MTQEEKQLLLQELCSRLPYGVICSIYRIDDWYVGWRDEKLSGYFYDGNAFEFYFRKTPISIDNDISKIKPYLRPMSSMTEEEKRHISKMMCLRTYDNGVVYDMTYPVYTPYYVMEDCLSYLRSIHVDYSGLIEKGLAIEVTKDNNPYEN